MSTPVAAGAVALVRQYFMQGWYPTGAPVAANAYTPSGPLLKAIVLGMHMMGPWSHETFRRDSMTQTPCLPEPPLLNLAACSVPVCICCDKAAMASGGCICNGLC